MINYLVRKTVRNFLKTYQKRVMSDIFTSTNIEVYGYCNRKCSFCFNSRLPERKGGIMDVKLWEKIIDELSTIKYTGRISPYFYGEPLLDKRIVELISYARRKCPYSRIHISSNGDKLTEELLIKLIENGLDKILITNYDDFEKEHITNLYMKYPRIIQYRNYKEIDLKNRAGSIFKKSTDMANKPCLRPSRQLVINWNGNLLLCCNDYYENYVFGNVKNESILEIWESEDFKKYREILSIAGGRKQIDICSKCDM